MMSEGALHTDSHLSRERLPEVLTIIYAAVYTAAILARPHYPRFPPRKVCSRPWQREPARLQGERTYMLPRF